MVPWSAAKNLLPVTLVFITSPFYLATKSYPLFILQYPSIICNMKTNIRYIFLLLRVFICFARTPLLPRPLRNTLDPWIRPSIPCSSASPKMDGLKYSLFWRYGGGGVICWNGVMFSRVELDTNISPQKRLDMFHKSKFTCLSQLFPPLLFSCFIQYLRNVMVLTSSVQRYCLSRYSFRREACSKRQLYISQLSLRVGSASLILLVMIFLSYLFLSIFGVNFPTYYPFFRPNTRVVLSPGNHWKPFTPH